MHSSSIRALLLTAGVCAACADVNPTEERDTPGGSSGASPYAFLRAGGLGYDEMAAAWAALPFDSITLARSGCFGSCPVYEVTFARGEGMGAGSALYQGDAYVEREGSFEGSIEIWDYARLNELFDHFGFLRLPEGYAAQWTDDETVRVEVSTGSSTHQVLDYGHQGPPELVALQLAIDAIVERIDWQAMTQ
jgi:hypothetical protein